MITYNKETPILLIVCGSFETTQQIYNELQRIEPRRLYLVFNSPENEWQKSVQKEIKSIFNNIKWECKIKILRNKIHSVNTATIKNYQRLILNTSMLKAVRWFFSHETEGIVLDGFSAPFPAFFAFCSCLLEKYRNDERIGHISSKDFLESNEKIKTNNSYYFSKLVHVSSGWASWRRVWQNLDVELKTFRSFKKLNIIENMPSHKPFRYIWHYFDYLDEYADAKYEYINLINNRLSIVPSICNISSNEYELPEINHPVFMVNPVTDELRLQEQKYFMPAITPNKPDGITFLQEKLLSFSREAKHRMKIPRIIHQIYEDPAGPPVKLLQIAESWKKKMPDWEYRFWNRQMIHEFLESTCPDFIPYYRSYPFNVQRWDAIRYQILYHIGGLYVDLDYECISPLDVLLTDSTCCMGMEPILNNRPEYNKSSYIGNSLMASTLKHPYMAAIIEDMKTNISVDYKKGDFLQILETTGPLMVTRVYEQFKRKKDVTLLSADLISPLSLKEVWMLRTNHSWPDVLKKVEKAFAIHYFFSSWLPQTREGKAHVKDCMQSE